MHLPTLAELDAAAMYAAMPPTPQHPSLRARPAPLEEDCHA